MNKAISIPIAAALILMTVAGRADEEKFPELKVGRVIYTNVVVVSKNPTEIFILHKGGATNLKLKSLGPELQKHFAFDPEKAVALERKRAEEAADYLAALAAANARKAPSSAPKEIWAKSFLGQKAPELVIQKWLTPQPETEGKFLLVAFWATSSAPSVKTVPLLNALHQKFGNKVVVIGLSDEPEEKMRALSEPPVDFFSGMDPDGKTLKQIEIKALPHVLLIDPAGTVRWEGFPLLEGHELTESIVQQIIEKDSPNPSEASPP